MDVNEAVLDLATKDISEDSPCGINAKYEADYENLEAEIAKSQSLTSESTDWDTVRTLAENILKNTSKDFTVACYFAYACVVKDGYKGLLEGFTLLEQLSEKFWQDMFPPVKRLRGRQASAQWLSEQVALYLEANDPSNADYQFIQPAAKTIKNLDFFLAEKMEDKAPNLADVTRPMKRLVELANSQAPAEKPAPAPAPAQAAAPEQQAEVQAEAQPEPVTAAQPAAPAPAPKPAKKPTPQTNFEPVGDIQNDQDAKKAFKQAQDILKSLASYHQQAKASDPKRYRYSRFALWGSLDKLPPAKDGKTQLPSPPADKLKKVVELFEAGEYLEAIDLAEKSAEKMPYWFDGNRYIVLSLEALGAEYEKAKEALIEQLVSFVQRVPKILDLQYSNGTPFVSDQCKTWIASLSESSNGNQQGSNDELASVFGDAKKLALSGKLNEAFELLYEQPAKTKRQKFFIKLTCAELACTNGQVKVGIPMLERLIEEVRSLTVADWESDFLSKALALLVNAYEKLDDNELQNKQKQKDAAYDQLCWYNPALITN